MHSIGTWWLWSGFFILIFTVLTIDIFLGRKNHHSISARKALTWTLIWFSCAMVFNAMLWFYLKLTSPDLALQKSMEFLTGYVIEETLSVDNMFVFLMIFNYFCVPAEHQRRVLLYGVLGAIIMRLIMILLGVWIINQLHWVIYLFGALILFTGIKMLVFAENEKDLGNNLILNGLRNHLRLTENFHGEKFFIKKNLVWYATPLFLVLMMIEFSDLIFALDSIPAIFAITSDPFIIFTSNIFAIMGLRALYFLLADMAARFSLLKYGIAIILIFIGSKMLIAKWITLPISITLSIVVGILASTTALSFLLGKRK